MPEMNDCQTSSESDQDRLDLPTRQKNALRILLSKPVISPQEVAGLDRRVLERAPGVGQQSVAIIRAWLNDHGYDLSEVSVPVVNQRVVQHKRKLERAIEYLRGRGYEVRRSR
ncbi:MAG: hypothetical protein WCK63_05095 [Betaproteobacteria bacterium]